MIVLALFHWGLQTAGIKLLNSFGLCWSISIVNTENYLNDLAADQIERKNFDQREAYFGGTML